jgi:predicted N-acyltransferase
VGRIRDEASTGYSYSVFPTIRAIDWDEWNSLRDSRSDPFMDPRFIRVVETSFADVSQFRHVMIRGADGKLLAVACLCSYALNPRTVAAGPGARFFALAKRLMPEVLRTRLVLCGLPVSAGQSQIRFAPEADRTAVLAIIDRICCQFASSIHARLILFKELAPAICEELRPLAALGYRRADSYPMNRADPKYHDFQDYLTKIKSKTRHECRRSQKKFAQAGLRVADLRGDAAADVFTDQVHQLYAAVVNRSHVQFEKVPATFFRDLYRTLPGNAALTAIYRDDQIVAFASSLYSDTTFHGLYIGLNYDLNSQSDLYFNLLFHAMDLAYRRQPEAIFVGQSADTIKHEKLNCYQVPLSLYVKGGRWSMRWFLKLAFERIFPPQPLKYSSEYREASEKQSESRG